MNKNSIIEIAANEKQLEQAKIIGSFIKHCSINGVKIPIKLVESFKLDNVVVHDFKSDKQPKKWRDYLPAHISMIGAVLIAVVALIIYKLILML